MSDSKIKVKKKHMHTVKTQTVHAQAITSISAVHVIRG